MSTTKHAITNRVVPTRREQSAAKQKPVVECPVCHHPTNETNDIVFWRCANPDCDIVTFRVVSHKS